MEQFHYAATPPSLHVLFSSWHERVETKKHPSLLFRIVVLVIIVIIVIIINDVLVGDVCFWCDVPSPRSYVYDVASWASSTSDAALSSGQGRFSLRRAPRTARPSSWR